MTLSRGEATQLLLDVSEGDQDAVGKLLTLVYDELRGVAESRLTGDSAARGIEPTALVREAYARLVGHRTLRWQDRSHFIAIAARAMRQILVYHALNRRASGRDDGTAPGALDEAVALYEEKSVDLIALDDALTRLERLDALQARIVELRFFGNLDVKEIAEVCGVTRRDVHHEWTMARAWLRRELDAPAASTLD